MPDTAPASRWTLTIEPAADGQAHCSYAGHVEGVTRSEVVHFLVRALSAFTGGAPLQVLPTEDQVRAHVARRQLIADNPATTTYVRDGYSIFVGPIPDDQAARLKAAGWVNGGAIPKGCTEPCLFVTEPDVFDTICEPAEGPASVVVLD